MSTPVYDLCIVGAGMTGSAAARHASSKRNIKICLIGPPEPKERKVETGNEVFGAYFDEGRLCRSTSIKPVWGTLGYRASCGYRDLEKKSGVHFFDEVGSLIVGTKDGPFMTANINSAKDNDSIKRMQLLDNTALKKKYPYLHFADDDIGLLETTLSGCINPRRMVDAQVSLASKQGCDVIRDVVTSVIREKNGSFRVVCEDDRLIRAKKVLLATNVFTSLHNLLGNIKPRCQLMPQTISFGEVSKEDLPSMRDMPTIMYEGKGGSHWPGDYPRNSKGNIHFYMLPPILYPDGKYYVKIGHSDDILTHTLKLTEIQNWYCNGGDRELEKHLFDLMQGVFQGVKFISHHGDGCVTMVTPNDLPYVDLVTPTLGVVMGDNGHAAKSSDELGRIAADMIVLSKWTYDIPRDKFKLLSEDQSPVKSKL